MGKLRFETTTLDSVYCETNKMWVSGGFKVIDNDWPNDFVTDQNGNDVFKDSQDFTDLPSHIPRYVTVYTISRCYGGAEEGGWWYDHYEPVESIRALGCSVDEVKAFVQKNWKRELNRKHNRDSVLGGDDYVVVVELNSGELSQPPPHYE